MKHLILLIKREYWEHKLLWLVPLGLFVTLTIIFYRINLFSIANEHIWPWATQVDNEIESTVFMVFSGFVMFIASAILGLQSFLYSLNAIYSDTKDNSRLFWKSLPIHDSTFVISKLLTSMITVSIPMVISLAVVFSISGLEPSLHTNLYPKVITFLCKVQAFTLIASFPFLCWGLFVSTSVSRNPVIFGVIVPIIFLISISMIHFDNSRVGIHLFNPIINALENWFKVLLAELGHPQIGSEFSAQSLIYIIGYLVAGTLMLLGSI